ncbi:SgcJ/EcaC family oxidoreductase [Agrobacterium sp. V1]|uniref:SgcJ/EcaC family oxidoreductase n=1 Tax=Agrobacterium sp. V1 TaxID=3061957 RepID=UPI002670FFCF|nr:SgcJ/EcaC family oxidoreductase [Agrobacterium sp. V1]MDO3445640.1 SgcJ/EcaC family oxidoreductase [Agrobacterium sp. V1]
MKRHLLAASVIALLATPAVAEECAPITKPQVKQLFDRWNASLATLNPEKVVDNYASDAVLLPTLSNKPRLTQEERKEYFVDFLKKHPHGEIDSRSIKLGCNEALDTGIYTFTLKDGSKVPARYTFTYEFKDDKWLISSHHSSAMPEKHPD